MENYLISGGTGFIGTHIIEQLVKSQHQVYVLTTRKQLPVSNNKLVRYIYWEPTNLMIDASFNLTNCKIINLAGAGVASQRWTPARKKEIIDSRIQSLATLYQAVKSKQIQATHMVSSSAIGYYGEGEKLFTEQDVSDETFLSSTCRQWEEAAWQFAKLDLPISVARIGIVLGNEGGAFKEFVKPLQFGIAGIPSDGRQIYSWIHIDDVSALLIFLSTHKKEGIFNAVGPHPSSVNQIIDEIIKHSKHVFFKAHAPQFMLQLMLGEMSIEVLKSSFVSSKKIEDEGFEFKYPLLETCISDLMKEA